MPSVLPRLSVSTSLALALCGTALGTEPLSNHNPRPIMSAEPFQAKLGDGTVINTELDTIMVPENRADVRSRKIPLRFVRLRSTATRPGHPIVYLSGGPGGSGTFDLERARGPMIARLRSISDVIVLDQRGTGNSNSIPVCQPDETMDKMNLTKDTITSYLHRQFGRCLRLWREAGVDPKGYTLLESARDLESIRRALGASKLNLIGISYGPQLAMAYMKLFPSRAAKLVSASGRGLDQTVRLPSEIDAFLARTGGPELIPLMRRVHAKLDAAPVTVTFTPRGEDQPVTLRFDSFPVRYAVSFFFLNDAEGVESLPDMYRQMDNGNYERVARTIYAQGLNPRSGRFTAYRGMGEIMDLSSNWSEERRRRWLAEVGTSALGDAHNFPVPQGLGIDRTLDIPVSLKRPLRNSTPALFISGTHDGRLPLESQAANIRLFSRGKQIILDRGGHNIFEQSQDIQDAVVRFFRDGTVVATRLTIKVPTD